jgi:trehalose-phosphatase
MQTVDSVPAARDFKTQFAERLKGKQLAIFLDYDGTLTPIIDDPNQAVLDNTMRDTLAQLAQCYTVSIISGRGLDDLRQRVQLDGVFYAGSHGFEIAGPGSESKEMQKGKEFLPDLDQAEQELHRTLDSIEACTLERKTFSIAIHYRQVADTQIHQVEQAVDRVIEQHPDRLRKGSGKMVFQVQPKTDWNKGHAVLWLLDKLKMDGPGVVPLYLGDDVTDEDAFQVLQEWGLGIVVGNDSRATAAQYRLAGPAQVEDFLQGLIDRVSGEAS